MWVVINGEKHTRVKTLEEGAQLMDKLLKQNPKDRIQLVHNDVYKMRDDKKTKRGKRS